MDVVKDVLWEDLAYSMRTKEKYLEIINQLPKGSLIVKNINGRHYYYLSARQTAKKIKQTYLGRLSEEEVNEYREKIAKRRKYRHELKRLGERISYLEKILHVKSKRSD